MADRWPVTLAGVRMDDTPDDDGVRWRITRPGGGDPLEGWDSPPVREDESEITGRDGGAGSEPLYGARLLTLWGRAHCPTIEVAFLVRDRLQSMPPLRGSTSLTVHEPVPKQLIVRRGATRSTWPTGSAPYRVTFQIPLTARNPFKLGLTLRTLNVGAGATVTAEHLGTAAADLRATVTSAGTVQLTAGGLTLTTSSLPVGAVIDTASCTVTGPTGTDLYTAVAAGAQWPALPAGGGPVTQAGAANLDVTYFDTYA